MECINALAATFDALSSALSMIEAEWKEYTNWPEVWANQTPDYNYASLSGVAAAQVAVWEAKKAGKTRKKLLAEVSETFPARTPEEIKAFRLAKLRAEEQKLKAELAALEEKNLGDSPFAQGPKERLSELERRISELEASEPEVSARSEKIAPQNPAPVQPAPPPPAPPREKRARQKRQTPEPLVALVRKWIEFTDESFDEWTEGRGSALQTEREKLEKELQVIKDRELQEKRLYGKSFLSSKEKADQWRRTERLKRVKLLCRIDELAPTPDALKAAFAETARLCEEERQEQLKMGKRPIGSNQPPLSAEELAVVRAAAEAKQAATAKEREQARAAEFEAQKARQATRVAEQKARRARLRDDLLSGKITDPQMIRIWLTPEERVRAHQARMTRGEDKNLRKEKPSDQPPMT